VLTAYKRRSDRLNITIPVAVEGMDTRGRHFKDDAQALVLSRFGGRIRLSRPLERGQKVLVAGPRAPSPAVFEVVETVVPPSGQRGEYGVACLGRAEDVWGIRVWGDSETQAEAKALVECRICRTVGFIPLSLSQVEALRGMGFVGLPCEECKATTPWAYWEMKVPIEAKDEGEAVPQGGIAIHVEHYTPRRHRRVYVQLPLKVLWPRGNAEITHTENVSRDGLGFLSCRRHEPGEQVSIRFPYDPSQEVPATRARILNRRAVEGSENAIYGVCFEPRH
jgi:PilZ domain-containing protein